MFNFLVNGVMQLEEYQEVTIGAVTFRVVAEPTYYQWALDVSTDGGETFQTEEVGEAEDIGNAIFEVVFGPMTDPASSNRGDGHGRLPRYRLLCP